MSAQQQAEQKPALTDVVLPPEAAPKPGAKLETAGGLRVGQRVISRVLGMTLRGRIAKIFIGIDGEPTLDITREWTSPPADREEAKERAEGGANNWYRSPGECQPWLNNPFEADGWVQASAAAQMHWRSGSKLLCARNAPKDALQLSSKPTYQRERQCTNCRAELARRTTQEAAPMTASTELPKKTKANKKTATAPTPSPVQPLFQPGNLVWVTDHSEFSVAGIMTCGVLTYHVESPPALTVLAPNGEQMRVLERAVQKGSTSPRAPLRAGDQVWIAMISYANQLYTVKQDALLSDEVQLEGMTDGQVTQVSMHAAHLLVARRVRVEDLYADLRVPFGVMAQGPSDESLAIGTRVWFPGTAERSAFEGMIESLLSPAGRAMRGNQADCLVRVYPERDRLEGVLFHEVRVVDEKVAAPLVPEFEVGELVCLEHSAKRRGVVAAVLEDGRLFEVRVQGESGPVTQVVEHGLLRPGPVPPARDVPLEAGDRVQYVGLEVEFLNHWLIVERQPSGLLAQSSPGGQNVLLTAEDREFQVIKRAQLKNGERDAGLIDVADPASLTGWFDPHGGITHWTQEGKALCGRALPKNLTLINADPDDQTLRARACVKCGKGLEKLQSAAIREHLKATHRVWATFPDGVRALAVSPSGTAGSSGLYGIVRELDGLEITASWRELTPAPALAIGDRVVGRNDRSKVGTVIGDYGDENKPLATKVRWDDGTEDGAHAANLRRVLDEVQPDAPTPEAPVPRVTLKAKALPEEEVPASAEEITPAVEASTPAFEIPRIDPFRPGIHPVAWNKLVASELNPRKHFEQASLIELAISIYRSGLKQNLQARPHPTRPGLFELAAGERRWRAIGLLVVGLEVGTGAERETLTVPSDYPVSVLIEELSDLDLIQNATAENVQRNDMTPLEVADAYAAMQERGATVESLAARFGKTKRFIQRRIDISRNLIRDLRELYDTGRLPLTSAELLAISPKATQQAIYKDTLRHQGVQISFEQLKNRLVGHLFHVDTAKFPRAWYTGTVNAGDLYGDLPAHFEDFDLAMSMQEKHAVALAQQDVADGADFADVAQRPEAMLWQYGKGNGVLYWINSKTGALKRHTGLSLLSYPAPLYRFEAPKPVPTHETPETSAPRPASADPVAAPDRPVSPAAPAQSIYYPRGLPDAYQQGLMQTALTQDRLSMALFIYTSLHEGWGMVDHPSSHEAALTAVQLTDGVLVPDQDSLLTIGKYPGQGTERYTAAEVGRALLSLPESLLGALHRAHCLEFATDVFGVSLVSVLRALPDAPVPVMDEAFLKACNEQAIADLWKEADMGSMENTTPEYLRSMLLEEAPALAAKGFLPRPWRVEA